MIFETSINHRNKMIQLSQTVAPKSSQISIDKTAKKSRSKRFYKIYKRTANSINFSAILAALFTLWLNHQAEIRQQSSSQNLNHQTILDGHINNIKEIKLSGDYKLEEEGQSVEGNVKDDEREDEFIKSMTLPVLRELSKDEDRKAQLVLFLHQLDLKTVSTSTDDKNSGQGFFQTADLKFGNFEGYKLTQINLKGADLRGADLKFANFSQANLNSADLSCADRNIERWWSWIPFVTEATQEYCASLNGINLSNADLSNAKLMKAELSNADLSKTKLNGANFSNANLTGADFTEANLTEANLTGANISDLQLSQAILCHTTLSAGETSNRDCTSPTLEDVSIGNRSPL